MRKVTTLVAILAATLILSGCQLKFPLSKQTNPPATQITTPETEVGTPKKSAHYESNAPEHALTLAGAPVNVVINFNFDLAKPSEIKIEKDGKDYGVGETVIDGNKLSMRRNMDPNSPDGTYTVFYNACWPDRTCHDGHFQFAVDKNLKSSFEDMTDKKEVTISMSQIKFVPMDIKINKGTRVTWVNDDEAEHYVNTDSHPAHTYYPNQNSKALKKGDSYSLTFSTFGIYPYHCSAHEAIMNGYIIVE